MLAKKVEKILVEQVEKEGYSSNLYLAMASWAETNGYEGISQWFYSQAEEEREHMLKIIGYINERGGHAFISGFEKPPVDYGTIKEAFQEVLKHEQYVTDSINNIVQVCIDEKDYTTHNWIQWFVTEQIEEEASVNTIIDKKISAVIHSSPGIVLDLFSAFLHTLEKTLGSKPQLTVGRSHSIEDFERYEDRMDATNYALNHDDGESIEFGKADLILVGVSRSGKTPTCLYMALHYGVKAANYPLTEDDLEGLRLPPFLRQHKNKIVGLMIDPERLAQIRETRRPNSRYASLKQCHKEVDLAESLLRSEGITVFQTTHASIEEISSRVLSELGVQREMF
jgi:regulator of PEP synthase PpsR (kinase-PPPase family)